MGRHKLVYDLLILVLLENKIINAWEKKGKKVENKERIYDSEQTFIEMEKKEIKNKYYWGGVISGLLFCLALMLVFQVGGKGFGNIKKQDNTSGSSKDKESVVNKNVQNKMELIEESIEKYYLQEYDTKNLEEGIYSGMLDSLGDPYSTYYSVEELQELQNETEGIYYGIGAYISLDEETKGGCITKVMDNSPAKEAGVMDGDIIVEVDGENVLGLSLEELVKKVKGPEDTQVVLTIYRKGETDYIEKTVTRKKIESPTVVYEMLDNHIAYIQITQFDSVTTGQFIDALKQAKEEEMVGLILDLRDNPGGNLSDVIAISREILPKGLIVYTEDKYGERKEYECDGTKEIDVPMVVLVNGYSASASEILAGAIKDYEKGTILGTTTYGKGIVQKIFPAVDGSALKLTVSHYFTPNGNNIHKVGVEPDEVLEFDSEAYIKDGTDNQLERAKEILGGK